MLCPLLRPISMLCRVRVGVCCARAGGCAHASTRRRLKLLHLVVASVAPRLLVVSSTRCVLFLCLLRPFSASAASFFCVRCVCLLRPLRPSLRLFASVCVDLPVPRLVGFCHFHADQFPESRHNVGLISLIMLDRDQLDSNIDIRYAFASVPRTEIRVQAIEFETNSGTEDDVAD